MLAIKWLSITDRHMKMYLDRQFAPLGLKSSQHMYIICIYRNPGITQDQLFSYFYLNPSNIARSVTALERNGFLIRKSNPDDKRTSRIYLTKKGEAVYQPILDILRQGEEQAMAGFSPEQREMFLDMLQKIGHRSVELCDYHTERISE